MENVKHAEQRQTILIVDDNPLNIKILGESLRNECNIQVAISGENALAIAASAIPPDLILLDIMMPDMDGYEVCKQLKANECTQNIPIIFISAKNADKDEAYGLELGAVDYIIKPFHLPIAHARIRTHLALKKKSDLLEKLTRIDGLTNIANRRGLNEFIRQEWNRGRRSGLPLSVIFSDIDHFKMMNDHYGHSAGDQCLINVAKVIEVSLGRATDFVGRYGGEEFVVILPETDLESATTIAEKIRTHIEQLNIPHVDSPVSDRITLSFGVASVIPHELNSPEALIKAADMAAYKAKNNGRNQVCVSQGNGKTDRE